MNLLEHYILEVASEEENKDYGGVNTICKVNCYGIITENYAHYAISQEQLDKEKKQGYFMS